MAWDIEGRTVVITGANSGIGLATALELARRGADVIPAVRNPAAGRAAADRIGAVTGLPVTSMTLDLASFASIRSFADRLTVERGRTDVLVNNAGVFIGSRRTTVDGFEWTMAVNHLGPYLLTCLLASDPETRPGRIVTVASAMHERVGRDPGFERLESPGRYRGTAAYARSKLANILFTRALAARLDPAESVAFALHPGMVATRIAQDGDSRLVSLVWRAVSSRLRTPAEGAATSVYLATEPGIEHLSGSYFSNERPVEPSAAGRNDAAAARLWAHSARATGCDLGPSPNPGDGTVPER